MYFILLGYNDSYSLSIILHNIALKRKKVNTFIKGNRPITEQGTIPFQELRRIVENLMKCF